MQRCGLDFELLDVQLEPVQWYNDTLKDIFFLHGIIFNIKRNNQLVSIESFFWYSFYLLLFITKLFLYFIDVNNTQIKWFYTILWSTVFCFKRCRARRASIQKIEKKQRYKKKYWLIRSLCKISILIDLFTFENERIHVVCFLLRSSE